MNIYLVLGILFVHWIADFVLQTDSQAKGKSKDMVCLLSHTFTYSTIFMLFCLIYVIATTPLTEHHFTSFEFVLKFSLITLVCHTVQDYITSRINARLWEQKKVHDFFVSIGFDQFLHFAQLLITFKLLTQ